MSAQRAFLAFAGLFGATGVALGAWAAHGLAAVIDPQGLAWVDTGLRYQLLHAAALLGLAAWLRQGGDRLLAAAGWLFAAGVLVFSGLLYAMALGAPRWLGAVVPLGGLSMIAGWLAVLLAALKAR